MARPKVGIKLMAIQAVSADQQFELAVRLLDDDEGALEEILRTLGPPILAVLRFKYRGVLGHEDTEDVLAVALHRLWESRRRFDDSKGSLWAWFFRIAENVAKDVLKCGWQKARQLELDSEQFSLDDVETSPPQPAQDGPVNRKSSKRMTDLKEVVASLPEPQRRIIEADALARDDVASSELLADELGIPAATVRVYRKRAMDKIRSEMKRRGHEVP